MNSYKNLHNTQQKVIHASILKYGWENHVVEILEEANPQLLFKLEPEYIKKYNTYLPENPLGMNLTRGGEGTLGRVDSECVRNKRSQSIKGQKRSDETRKVMSELKKGKIPSCTKLPRSEKQLHHYMYGNNGKKRSLFSEDTRLESLRLKMIDKHESILQIEASSGNIIKEWTVLSTIISKELGIDYSHLQKCIKVENKKCKGFYWRYKK
jgi:hypothetical protein